MTIIPSTRNEPLAIEAPISAFECSVESTLFHRFSEVRGERGLPLRRIPAELFLQHTPAGFRYDQMHVDAAVQQAPDQADAVRGAARARNADDPALARDAVSLLYHACSTTRSSSVNANSVMLSAPFIVKNAVCTRLMSLGFTSICWYQRNPTDATAPMR